MIAEIIMHGSLGASDVLNLFCANKAMHNLLQWEKLNKVIPTKIAQAWSMKYSTPQRALVAAAREGRMRELKALVETSIDPFWNDFQALRMAIYNQQREVIDYLLALPNIIGKISQSAKDKILSELILESNVELFELIITHIPYDFNRPILYPTYQQSLIPLRLVSYRSKYSSKLLEAIINNTPYTQDHLQAWMSTLFDSISNQDKNIIDILLEYSDLRHLLYQHTILYPSANSYRLKTLQQLLSMDRNDLINFLKN